MPHRDLREFRSSSMLPASTSATICAEALLNTLWKGGTCRLPAFHIRGKELRARAEFTEYRMRQTALDKIVIEFGGGSELKASELNVPSILIVVSG
jgi:hypothetical protein